MPSAGFEPATPATKRPQTYALDRAATEVGNPSDYHSEILKIPISETCLVPRVCDKRFCTCKTRYATVPECRHRVIEQTYLKRPQQVVND
jgi:hypothetical protein